VLRSPVSRFFLAVALWLGQQRTFVAGVASGIVERFAPPPVSIDRCRS